MSDIRIIGDVHAQVVPDDVVKRNGQSYVSLIEDAAYSVQIGDMGDSETYDQLLQHVDPVRHRFFPGNHDHHHCFPPHCLGDFGIQKMNGVEFFFIRGAASSDRNRLVELGKELGKKLWFEEEELTIEQMKAAETSYLEKKPNIVLSHDAPMEIAVHALHNAIRNSIASSSAGAVQIKSTRTTDFLQLLLDLHAPKLWLFGHYHHNWQYRLGETLFVCVGELAYVDVDSQGNLIR